MRSISNFEIRISKLTFVLLASSLLATRCLLTASEVMHSANIIPLSRVNGQFYFALSDKDISFDGIGDYRLRNKEFAGKIAVKPWRRLGFFAKLGKSAAELLGREEEIKSVNPFDGWTYGGGLKWVFLPDTIVTPAIAAQLELLGSTHRITHRGITAVNQTLSTLEVQGVMMLSKRFGFFEPHIGGRFLSLDVALTDNAPAAVRKKIDGGATGTSGFLGLRYVFSPGVSLVGEGSLGFEKGFAFGFHFGF